MNADHTQNSNKADLLKLEALVRQMQEKQQQAHTPLPVSKQDFGKQAPKTVTLKRLATVVRFVVRLQMMARAWKKQEQLRKMLLSRYEADNQNNEESKPKPKPRLAGQQQVKVKHVEQKQKKTALRFGAAMSVDLEASSSTAREEHGVDVDVGADSAAELWLSGDEIDGWGREEFMAPQQQDEHVEGTEAISVDST